MNPYRILKTDNGYEIVRVSYDEDGDRPVASMPVDFIAAADLDELAKEVFEMISALHIAKHIGPLTYADFKREG